MKWLLVNPRPEAYRVLGTYEPVMVPFAPMGLAYLASSLEAAGHSVLVHDEFVESPAGFFERLKSFKPDIVGISCLTPAMQALPERVSVIRAELPGAVVVCGNIHATLFYEDVLKSGLADFVVLGEGEETVVALGEHLAGKRGASGIEGLAYLENGEIRANKKAMTADLDALPLPAWHLFNTEKYVAPPIFSFRKRLLPVLASRGCPFSCYFCAQNVLSPKLRRRDPRLVADEIEYFYNRFGIDLFWFADAVFPLSRADGDCFSREMIGRGLAKKISWITETRVDLIDREMIRTMKQAGLMMLIFGLESGDPGILAKVKPGASLSAARRAVDAARREKVLTLGLFILGLPGENRKTMAATMRFSKEIGLDFAKFNRAVPYPGSAFFDDVFQGDPEPCWRIYNPNHDPGAGGGLVYRPEGITEAEFIKIQKRAFLGFYLRPRLALRHILRGTISPRNMIRGGLTLLKNR